MLTHGLRLLNRFPPLVRLFSRFPAHELLKMPALSPTMTEGTIVKWNKKVGEKITAGEVMFEVETDKAVVGYEVQDEVFIAKILATEGSAKIPLGHPVAVLVSKADRVSAFADFSVSDQGSSEPAAPTPAPAVKKTEASKPVASNFPAHELLKMPALSPTMTEGTIVKWNKKVGEKVSAGEVMFEVETDKAVVGYEVQDEVFIAKIFAEEGKAKIPLGHPVAVLVSKADRVAAFKEFSIEGQGGSVQVEVKETPVESVKDDRIFISPIAKKTANENNLDYTKVAGSGPNGRIVKNDVEAAISSTKVPPPVTKPVSVEKGFKEIPTTPLQRSTAARYSLSKQTVPHFYINTQSKMDKILSLQKLLTEASGSKLTINDFVLKAAASACTEVQLVNSTYENGVLITHSNVDILVPVQTANGVESPIIKNVQLKRIGEISKEVKDFSQEVRNGENKASEVVGGTFTVSNLGMHGVKEYADIINPPQVSVLAVGMIHQIVVPDETGFKTQNLMTVTLSCDHRVIDPAVGGMWLKAFKKYIEEPYLMLL